MSEKCLTIDQVREGHKALLHLAAIGTAFACPGLVAGDPGFRAACHCSADERERSIPYGALAAILRAAECRFLARHN